MSEQDADTRGLRVLGFVHVGLYLVLAVFFWTAWTFKKNVIDEVILFVVTGALTILYFVGLKFARGARTSAIVMFAAVIAVIGFITPPFDSTDVFFYMATGWQQAHYGLNPYSKVLRNVDSALSDPMIQNDGMSRNRNPWLDIPVPYGFLFSLLTRAIAWLGQGNLWLTLGLFSLLNLLMHAGTALVLWKTASVLPHTSGKVLLYLYGWNPFIVLQHLADLHNDVIVGFLVVLAAYLLLKDRAVWTLPILVAAALIKYATLVLVPFALLFLLRYKGWKNAVKALSLSIFLIVVAAAPYVGDAASFKYSLMWAQFSESTGSLHAFGMYSFRAFNRMWPTVMESDEGLAAITKVGLWIGFVIFVVFQLRVSWNERSLDPLRMIQRWTSILFALIFVASSQFYAWYIGMIFPLALLTHGKTILTDCVIALSGAHILSFTFLRRKAIGYFVVATAFPILLLLIPRYRRARPLLPILSYEVEKPREVAANPSK
jgi:alpha-1,6-mannosyltransferase